MPELRFVVRWPDGSVHSYYSPSLVVRDFLAPGASYPVATFVERCREALEIASERVREKYGFACARAVGELARIDEKARNFDPAAAVVRVEGFES
jgi:uncharacterized repeat protein (TIGR04042 family)